jgi:NAD(P)-dependent dehydrogenase (short-subunit alcohol dehydrogenase family)
VTGAGRGLGRAYAELLASRGAAVVVNDLGVATKSGGAPSPAPADEVVESLRAQGHRAIANYSDIGDPASGSEIVDAAMREFGRVDIVLNNAGTVEFHPIEELSAERFLGDLSVHLAGSFHLTRAAWPHLKKQSYGRVLMTASTSVFGQDNAASYGAAKAGILGLTASLALEGAPHGILVNAVAPSAATRMAVSPKASVASNTARPELAAEAAGWLLHEGCTWNGQVFHAGNGRLSRIFLGETRGYVDPELTIESVAENEKLVTDEATYIVPASVYEAISYHRELTPSH